MVYSVGLSDREGMSSDDNGCGWGNSVNATASCSKDKTKVLNFFVEKRQKWQKDVYDSDCI